MSSPTNTQSVQRASLASAALIGAGLIAVVAGLLIGGGAAAQALADPGEVVRWGLPVAKLVMNFSMAIAIGTLIFAAFTLSQANPLLARAQVISSIAAAVWAVAGAVNFLFTYLSVAGVGVSTSESFSNSLWLFATEIELGQMLALNLVAAVILNTLTISIRNLTATAMLAALGLAALIPLALIGHAVGSENHGMAVNSIGIHLVAVTIWVGGLFALFVVRGRDAAEASVLTKRYSSLALLAFVLVAVSGLGSAWVRIPDLASLNSPYGHLLLLKVVTLAILGVVGALYRRNLIARLSEGANKAKAFWSLVAVEFGIMGAAIGLATALARTASPKDGELIGEVTPAQILTGSPLPPELTPIRLLTEWKLDLVWLIIGVGAIWMYLAGVRRLAKRGDKWPIGRTVSWIAGMLVLIYTTSGALNAYQEYLFSMHMIGHMILAMGIPVLLVPGAPVTLLMRAAEKRQDGSRGMREWVLWAVHTKYARFVAHPIVAAILFASSLVTFYYTPLFAWATNEHLGHEWMVVHFLITGYLFAQALIGVDPGPVRLAYPLRLLMLIGTMAFHAFFGLSLMDGSGLLLSDWYGAMGRTWGETPLEDQHTGGAIAWGIGELPTAALTIIVSVQWFKADGREAKRLDRASDRTGNQDVEAYNQMLAKLNARKEER
ncbi:cytochrome c oxidase assembly protein [Rhodoluna limnophila]|uniref:cytochrome c oxidase assembly protein n=1 Tax=Rhodoluna limnophila TaxID=232537 RepID=UPI001FEF8D17|nr:cytochrome c oxidase assembly protein [Rhodoluna limnophila]